MTRPRFLAVNAAAYLRSPLEEEMGDAIEQIVKLKGGRLWRVNDSRNCPELADVWDLSILVPGWAMLLELKSNGRVWESAGQEEVAARLADVRRIVCGVVRPEPGPGEYGYDELLDILRSV